MSMSLEEALRAALDDEYHARATYRAVLDALGEVRPFVNIVESEERHIQALKRQFQKYGIVVPRDAWPGKVPAPESMERACEDAVKAERENARCIRSSWKPPVSIPTFKRLSIASRPLPESVIYPRLSALLARKGAVGGGGRGRRRRHRGGSR